MSLSQYRQKRSFERTSEPEGGAPAKGIGNTFCVQRHDATRLHYDFRLEMDGVLKSWAVPKGPSLEPLSKQLAVLVEDHPLEYGGFEGNIPKGQYGGGSVMLWDRGTWDLLGDLSAPAQLERGDLKLRLHGEKLRGEFALVHMRGRGKGNEWLLIKKKDAEARPGWNVEDYARSVLSGRTQEEIAANLPAIIKKERRRKPVNAARLPGAVKSPMPAQVSPMLAQLTRQVPAGENWLYEIKWDGVRALCFLESGESRMYTRAGNRCDQQYPELSVLPHHVDAASAVLDGEIVVLDGQGRSRFGLIQPRIGVTDANTIAHLARSKPVALLVFDLLYLDGYDLRGVALAERKRTLSKVLKPSERIRLSESFDIKGGEMLEAARQLGLEGIVAKRADSAYEGRRSGNWLKIKTESRQEFVIGGYTKGERAGFSSLILGLYNGGRLVHAGQAGTGFTEKTIADILRRLQPLETARSPFHGLVRKDREAVWVRPELVCEVKYLEFTEDGMLRAPVFIGLREDKDPRECVRETERAPAPAESRLDLTGAEATADLDGHRLKFTNLNKIYYPKDDVAKRDVITYYDAVADLILPHLHDRPLSLKRYPNGIDGEFFFQKEGEGKFPPWVRLEPVPSDHKKSPIHFVIANDRATLLYLTNLGCIDQNPAMSRIGSLEHPDFALIDLDPVECAFDRIVEAAQLMKQLLDAAGLSGYPKTTGGDGMHIYVPLEPVYAFEQARSFAEILSLLSARERPDLFTTPRAVSRRTKGKVYFDYLQIASAKTIAAPYVLRAYPGAPVATPLHWDEVTKGLHPGQFNIRNAAARFARAGDLFQGVLTNPQRLESAIERLGGA